MKNLYLIIICILLGGVTARAQTVIDEGTIDVENTAITWIITENGWGGYKLTIGGDGEYRPDFKIYSEIYPPWYSYAGDISTLSIDNDNIISIWAVPFSGCSGLTSINVNSSNQNYSSKDGILFNKDKTRLIQYPGGKTIAYSIPSSVTTIVEEAFSYCSGLTSVIILEGVVYFGTNVFQNCSGLAEITNNATTPKYIIKSILLIYLTA